MFCSFLTFRIRVIVYYLSLKMDLFSPAQLAAHPDSI